METYLLNLSPGISIIIHPITQMGKWPMRDIADLPKFTQHERARCDLWCFDSRALACSLSKGDFKWSVERGAWSVSAYQGLKRGKAQVASWSSSAEDARPPGPGAGDQRPPLSCAADSDQFPPHSPDPSSCSSNSLGDLRLKR